MITHKNVGRKSTVWNDATDSSHSLQIPSTGVFPVHQLQDAVTATLHRQMNMTTDVRMGCNHMERVVTHILRMGSGETNAHVGHSLSHKCQKVRKGHFLARFFVHTPVTIDILAQQGNLLEASVAQVSPLRQDAGHLTTPFSPTSIRNNTIVTEIVTSSHDADKTTHMSTTHTFWKHITIGLCGAEFHIDGFLAHLNRSKKVWQ